MRFMDRLCIRGQAASRDRSRVAAVEGIGWGELDRDRTAVMVRLVVVEGRGGAGADAKGSSAAGGGGQLRGEQLKKSGRTIFCAGFFDVVCAFYVDQKEEKQPKRNSELQHRNTHNGTTCASPFFTRWTTTNLRAKWREDNDVHRDILTPEAFNNIHEWCCLVISCGLNQLPITASITQQAVSSQGSSRGRRKRVPRKGKEQEVICSNQTGELKEQATNSEGQEAL